MDEQGYATHHACKSTPVQGQGMAHEKGVLWWAGGLLGIFLSRGGKRSFVPAVMYVGHPVPG